MLCLNLKSWLKPFVSHSTMWDTVLCSRSQMQLVVWTSWTLQHQCSMWVCLRAAPCFSASVFASPLQVMAVVGGCECSDASVFISISTVVLFHHGASGHLPPSITSVIPEELRHRTTLIITKTPESLRGTGLFFSRSLSSNLLFSPEKRSSPKTKRAVVVNSEAELFFPK